MNVNRLSMIGVRVTPEFREQIAAKAEKRFGGNESLLMRSRTLPAGRVGIEAAIAACAAMRSELSHLAYG